jgi:hypothetical protein
LRLCAVENLKLLKMNKKISKLKKPMAQNRLLTAVDDYTIERTAVLVGQNRLPLIDEHSQEWIWTDAFQLGAKWMRDCLTNGS